MLTLYSGGIPVAQLKMMLGLGAVGVALSPDGNGGSDITTKRKVPADFNGDGLSDILWQNDDGSAAIWGMYGASVIGGGVLPINPGPSFTSTGRATTPGRPRRHPVAECEQRSRGVGDERNQPDRQRQPWHPGPDLARLTRLVA